MLGRYRPSYNLAKELNANGISGDNRCNYSVNIDKDGFVKSIVIMTERNCRYVLDWVLELNRKFKDWNGGGGK